MESGDLAKSVGSLWFVVYRFWLQQFQQLVGAIAPDMGRLSIGKFYVALGIIRLLDPGIHFGAVQEAAELVQLGHIDELPLHELLLLVIESVLLPFTDDHGLPECFFFISGVDQAKLFVELWGMVAIPADDPENDLGKIPVHG